MEARKTVLLLLVVSFVAINTQDPADFDYKQHGKDWPGACSDPSRKFFMTQLPINLQLFYQNKQLQKNPPTFLLILEALQDMQHLLIKQF